MGWLETMSLIAVLVMIAIAAAAGGFWASVGARPKKSRARGPFLVGLFCGVMVGAALTGRRRGLIALGASTLKAVIRSPRAGIGLAVDGVAAGALTVVASLVRLGPASSIHGFRKYCLRTGLRISRMPMNYIPGLPKYGISSSRPDHARGEGFIPPPRWRKSGTTRPRGRAHIVGMNCS